MRLEYTSSPWTKEKPGPALAEVKGLLAQDVWKRAATAFYDKKMAAQQKGKLGPQGIQSFLNGIIDSIMLEAGWEGSEGRYKKDAAWARITFRHQMSLEADFLEALRVSRKEGAAQTAIIAASNVFLRLISPRDAHGLCSYEKFREKCLDLDGCLDFSLFIGRLEPAGSLTDEVRRLVEGPRPRGRTVPPVQKNL